MSDTPSPQRRVILLSGMSGAGLSTCLKIFEDLGYEAVDNLRLSLIPALIDDATTARRHLAISIDTRNANFIVGDLLQIDHTLADRQDLDVSLLFLDCSDERLQRRFTETRRRHPLAFDRPVTDGIRAERELLWNLKNESDRVIDTSETSIHELRRLISGHYRFDAAKSLTLYLMSFSYRHGIPREADLVFDVRFLANPHWVPTLRPLTGKDATVAAHVQNDPDYPSFIANLTALILPLLPRYQQEGKSYLTIAFGCSGGKHRSVMMAEELAGILRQHGYAAEVGHRDLDRPTTKA